MTKQNALKEKLQSGETVVGTWAWLPSPNVAELMALAGFDFFIVDMEHGPHSLETAQAMIMAGDGSNCTPLVRVPGVDESAILRTLDLGAHGIVVPNIQTVADAKQTIRFAKYPPIGERGHSPFTRAGGYTHLGAGERMQSANQFTFIGLLIEGATGFKNLPEILEACGPHIDLIYVGIYDVAKSAGHPGDIDHPDVQKMAEDIIQLCRSKSVCVGILANDFEAYDRYIGMGAQFIAYQNDTGILHQAISDVVSHAKPTRKEMATAK